MINPIVYHQTVGVANVQPFALHHCIYQLIGIAFPIAHNGDLLIAESANITSRTILGYR